MPAYGLRARRVGDNRAAISIGVNPHYGGQERRVEAFLLDFEGNLYGDDLVIELLGNASATSAHSRRRRN